MTKIADLYIEGYIGEKIEGSQTFGLSDLNRFLASLDSDVTDIHIHINSGGGNVDDGFAIYDKLKSLKYNLTTIGEGIVGSIATVIYLAGDTRKMFKNSRFFIHNPYISYAENLESKDAQKLADELKWEEQRILDFYVNKTGKEAASIKPFMDKETSFTTDEAINMGFVSEVVGEEIKNKKEYKLVANINPKIEIMKKEEQVSWFKKIENMIKNLKPAVKNEMTETSEGVAVWYEGTLEVGTKLFTDESMSTPAPDGVHTVGNIEYTVKDGAVESFKEVVNELEALKAENEKLKTEIANHVSKIAEFENSSKETEAKIAEIAKEIEGYKKVVVSAEAPAPTEQKFPKEKEKSADRFGSVKKNLVNKYGKKK